MTDFLCSCEPVHSLDKVGYYERLTSNSTLIQHQTRRHLRARSDTYSWWTRTHWIWSLWDHCHWPGVSEWRPCSVHTDQKMDLTFGRGLVAWRGVNWRTLWYVVHCCRCQMRFRWELHWTKDELLGGGGGGGAEGWGICILASPASWTPGLDFCSSSGGSVISALWTSLSYPVGSAT